MKEPYIGARVSKLNEETKKWDIVGTITGDCQFAGMRTLFEYVAIADGKKHFGSKEPWSPFYID